MFGVRYDATKDKEKTIEPRGSSLREGNSESQIPSVSAATLMTSEGVTQGSASEACTEDSAVPLEEPGPSHPPL